MPREYSYMTGVKSLPSILQKLKVAQTPPKFTHEFLKSHLGFSSSSDRPVIQVLKGLGFLAPDSRPTARYNEFRSSGTSGAAMAAGLREGWSDVFLADQNAHTRSPSELKEIFKNVSGKSEAVAEKMARTFSALAAFADFKATPHPQKPQIEPSTRPPEGTAPVEQRLSERRPLDLSLRNDVHVHLPATSDVAVYSAIFRALREELLD